jgi:hypothetical protein
MNDTDLPSKPPPPEVWAPQGIERRPIGRAVADRVLRRAIELQAARTGASDALDEEQLALLAEEIGLDPDLVRRALAEEHAGLRPAEEHVADRFVGPQRVIAGRSVRGTPGALLEEASQWLQRHEGLRVQRRLLDGVRYEADRSLLAGVRSGLGLTRGTGNLRSADEIALRIQPLDAGESLVTVEADVQSLRRQTAAGLAGSVAAAAVAGWIGQDLMGTGGWLLALPAAMATGGAVVSNLRRRLVRIRRGLERTLDALALPEKQPPALNDPFTGAIEGARRLGQRVRQLSEAFRQEPPDRRP